jgi:hypothetical protein
MATGRISRVHLLPVYYYDRVLRNPWGPRASEFVFQIGSGHGDARIGHPHLGWNALTKLLASPPSSPTPAHLMPYSFYALSACQNQYQLMYASIASHGYTFDFRKHVDGYGRVEPSCADGAAHMRDFIDSSAAALRAKGTYTRPVHPSNIGALRVRRRHSMRLLASSTARQLRRPRRDDDKRTTACFSPAVASSLVSRRWPRSRRARSRARVVLPWPDSTPQLLQRSQGQTPRLLTSVTRLVTVLVAL